MTATRSRKLVIEGGEKIVDFNIKAFKPAPEEGIQNAVELMRDGIMYRYQHKTFESSHTSMFEKEFAEYHGSKYAVGLNSCGSAMFVAMNIAGVKPGDKVLSNAFTFTAVPSVIHHARATPVLVESNHEWGMDAEDLEKKVIESGAKVLLMSYMRGHVPDIDAIMAIVTKYDLFFIEDCAHAYNTFWDGIPLGRFGKISCFSTQSSKGLSSGEGGIFVTDNEEFAAKAILYAGSYEKLWQAHYNVNPELMNKWQNQIPGYSLRMQEITASILRPQISRLNVINKIHTENFGHLEELFSKNENIEVPQPFPKVTNFNDTMQFHLVGLTREQADQFIEVAGLEGIPMQIFGAGRNARDFREWKYTGDVVNSEMHQTVANIEFACDLSLQPHLGIAEIETIASVISDVLLYVQE